MMDTDNDVKPAARKLEVRELRKIDTDRQVCRIRYSPDGKVLFSGGYDSQIRRWDLTTEEPQTLEPLIGHHGWVQSLSLLPDGQTLVSVDSLGQLCAWSVHAPAADLKWHVEQAHDGWIHDLAVSKDGSVLATVGRDRFVRLWSADDGALIKQLPQHEHEPFCVAIHPDNQFSEIHSRIDAPDLFLRTTTRSVGSSGVPSFLHPPLSRIEKVLRARPSSPTTQGPCRIHFLRITTVTRRPRRVLYKTFT